MTEKRFMASINNNVDVDYDVEIWDYNKHLDPSEVVDLLNELNDENVELEKRISDISLEYDEELLYYKTKCGSLEEGLFKQDREISHLKKENKKLKQNNDIKFWKQEYMKLEKHKMIFVNELRKAHEEGYEFSDEFNKYSQRLMEEIMKEFKKKSML